MVTAYVLLGWTELLQSEAVPQLPETPVAQDTATMTNRP
jgi:hypothetical protein